MLAFAQRQVTHVTFLTASGVAPGLFILRSHSQGYRPRYAFTSQDAPHVVWEDNIRRIAGDSAKSQYLGAVGVGWFPFADVADATAPTNVPRSFGRCMEVMRRGGLDSSDTNYNGLLAFVCDGFWFLDTAFEAGGATTLSAASFVDGENRLGTSYIPAAQHADRSGSPRRRRLHPPLRVRRCVAAASGIRATASTSRTAIARL